MIYLTAQPATVFFYWQLELQLRNLRKIGVRREQIHVLLAVGSNQMNESDLTHFVNQNEHLAEIYIYVDERDEKVYISSVRPHIIRKHFKENKYIEEETIIYIDSDVLLERKFDVNILEDNCCYVSDTRNYLDSDYVINSGSEKLLSEMASAVGISVDTITRGKENTGGAQYILKEIPELFWEKVEKDSVKLYKIMLRFNEERWKENYLSDKSYRTESKGIQAWCADMWAVLWNLWYYDREVKIHREMDFLWPDDPIEKWGSKIILHYTGITKTNNAVFNKGLYLTRPPWYDSSLRSIPETNCSKIVYTYVMERKEELDAKREKIDRIKCVYKCNDLEIDTISRFKLFKTYFQKFVNVKVFLFYERNLLVAEEQIPDDVISCSLWDSQKEENGSSEFKYLIIPLGVVFDAKNLIDIQHICLEGGATTFCGEYGFKVDFLIFKSFVKYLDIQFLTSNVGKFDSVDTKNFPILLCESLAFSSIVKGDIKLNNIQTTNLYLPQIFYAP